MSLWASLVVGPKTHIGMGWMRRRLTGGEKDRIVEMLDAGKTVDMIAKALSRPKNTIYTYVYYGRYTPLQRTRNTPGDGGRPACCPTCEKKLTFDTTRDGYLVEYCQTCVKPAA